jgi:hypothetical protein
MSDMIGGGEQPETIITPHLALIANAILKRPLSERSDPLAVEPELWHRARGELQAVLNARGWPMVADKRTFDNGHINFLLYGCPIVMLNG